jgi:hypothetical protein
MIQKFSFDFRDRYFGFDGLQFAFRVCTFENVYGTDPGQVVVTPRGAGIRCEAQSLQFAGGQRQCPGRIVADIWRDDNELKFKATVQHQEGVKGITTLIRGLAAPVGEERIGRWPTISLRKMPFPEIDVVGGGTAGILPSTTRLRFRRWAVYQEFSGNWVLNLSEDEDYTERSQRMQGSEWVLIRNPAPNSLRVRWYGMLEKERGLRPWEERTDVPNWVREVCLVLNMHCEAWTGYVFNTFERQLEILRWIAERIEGRRVLVYLPAWDGRYYWDYPIYEPSKACGGTEGLHRLVDGAHQLGMHVIPMFGLIGANYRNTRELGLGQAACRTAYDLEEICDWTEWDEDLSTEPIWQPLNVGEAGFRQHLLDRICWVTDTFGTDGAMLDICGWMPRDPRHNLFEGLSILVKELRARYSDFLVFGEEGCDLHLPFIPFYHHYANLPADHPFHRYCRTAYHLQFGAPGQGSTGVHERGVNPYERPSADKPAVPTLSVVGDTLVQHSTEVEEVIEVSKKWATRWLK